MRHRINNGLRLTLKTTDFGAQGSTVNWRIPCILSVRLTHIPLTEPLWSTAWCLRLTQWPLLPWFHSYIPVTIFEDWLIPRWLWPFEDLRQSPKPSDPLSQSALWVRAVPQTGRWNALPPLSQGGPFHPRTETWPRTTWQQYPVGQGLFDSVKVTGKRGQSPSFFS